MRELSVKHVNNQKKIKKIKKIAIEYVSLKSELSEPSGGTRLLLLAGKKNVSRHGERWKWL